jgi:hypothetical protein
LNEPRICALIGKGEAAGMAQHVRISEQRQGSGGTKFPQKQVNGRAVQRFALRAYKERLTGRFHPDAFFQPSVDGSKFVAV